MGFLSKLLGDENERFYQLVIKSLNGPTTGLEYGIKPFVFEDASGYAHGYVPLKCYEILDNDNTVRFPYHARHLKDNDPNFYVVVIRNTSEGLAEFESRLDN